MKAESLYIQKLTYDENTGNEIIGLFPSEGNPVIVSSYTYDAKRMGGAPTLTATIYSSEPLQWKKEEFVEYNGDRFFASYTPNSTKDNSSRMWKSEITFTSRRELLDNTLFFDVVVDDVDTQNKDRYRSNQTKFTFGGTIYEFVARINSSMAYCGLYRPTDEYKGYYVVVDEGYGTDEVKEVSFEDQYLTDVLQLINTTFELDYYWDGNVCHVGKVQHDLTDTPIKYGCSDALISVSKENANYKIVDMITGYGSSDNLPYYYPNDDEFGEAVFNTENFSKSLVSSISLGDVLKWNSDVYNNTLILGKNSNDYYTANVFGTSSYLITNFGGKDYKGKGEESKNVIPTCSMGEEYKEHNFSSVSRLIGSTTIWTLFEFNSSAKEDTVKMDGLSFVANEADSDLKFGLEFSYEYAYYVGENTNIDTAYKSIHSVRGGGSMSGESGGSFGNSDSDVSNGWSFGDNIDGLSNYTKSSKKEHTFERNSTSTIVIACKITATNIKKASGTRRMNTVSTSISGSIELTHKPSSVYYFETSDGHTQPYDESGININGIGDIPHKDLTFSFDGTYWNATEGGENNAAKITITDRVWLAPSSVLMPSIYRNTKGTERFYYALNNTHKLPSGSGYYEFVNLYKKGNPHQGTVTFDGIKPTINGIVNAEGQLFGEIADVAFDKEDSDVKDSDGNYIHSYFYIKLHKFNGDFGFDLFSHALASEPAKINLIKSNGCPSCSFVIHNQPSADNSKCYNCVSVDENGNLKQVRTDKNDYIFANARDAYEDKLNQDSTQKELWIAVQKDTSTLGIVMPNASAGFKPQKGDLFVITGIKPPKVLVTAAEKRLDDALIKHMSENNTDQFNYSVKFSRIFLQENPDFASKLNENAKLSIQIQGDSDSDGNLISHEVFVSNYSVKVDNDELAEVEVELVNSLEVTKSDVKQIIDSVKGETVKSLSSMVGGSNTNNFNASITDKMYLSKLTDDIASGTITFQKVQKFLQGLNIGEGNGTWSADGALSLFRLLTNNFDSGPYGHGAQIDEKGNIEANSIYARQFISAPKFVFNEISVTKAEQWNTNGYGTIESVDVKNRTITLHLEENDYGSLQVGDICRGIYADIDNTYSSDNIEEGALDDCNFVQHKGFFSTYFYVMHIITNEKGKFVFQYGKKSQNTPDPCAYMDFAQYGSFTDEKRQSSMYFSSRGNSFIEVLDGVKTWEVQSQNRVARYGWLGGLTLVRKDGSTVRPEGNGIYVQDNIYFGGNINYLQGLSGLDDLREEAKAYDVSLSQYQSVVTVDDMGNVINGLYTEDEAKTTKQYRIYTAVFVRKGMDILLEEDGNTEDVTTGHYRVHAVSEDCEVMVQNSTIFVTAIKNIKDGVAGTTDDANFDYDAMRKATDAMVTIVVELEGKTSKMVQMPIRIQHDTLPFMVCDLSNESASVAWNTKTSKYIGLPIKTKVSLMYHNEPWAISSLNISNVAGLKTSMSIDGKAKVITIDADNLTVDTLAQVTKMNITVVGRYAGANYEYTRELTILKSSDTVVYELIPSADSVIIDNQGNMSAESISCDIWATSSDDKRYKLTELPVGYHLKHGTTDTPDTNIEIGEEVSVQSDASQVVFALYDASGNVLDKESVPVLTCGADGDGYEYIYYRSSSSSASSIPTPRRQNGSLTDGWHDDPMPPTVDEQYVYVAYKKGAVGSDGTFSAPKLFNRYPKSISKQETKFYTTSSLSPAPEAWEIWNYGTTSMPTDFNDSYPWLWKVIRTTYTDGTTDDVVSCEGYKATDGAPGTPGEPGAPGVGIDSIQTYYLISSKSEGIKISSSGWSTDMVNPTSSKPYLWSYVKTTLSNGDFENSTPVIIGNFAEAGIMGENGCIIRPSIWKSGAEYRNDSALTNTKVKYIDLVYVEDANDNDGWRQYMCALTHTSASNNSPTSSDGSTYWTELSDTGPIYAPLILAKNAVLNFTQGQQFNLVENGKIFASYRIPGSDGAALWLGGSTASSAPFSVDKNGRLKSTSGIIGGVEISEEKLGVGVADAGNHTFTGAILSSGGLFTGYKSSYFGAGVFAADDPSGSIIQMYDKKALGTQSVSSPSLYIRKYSPDSGTWNNIDKYYGAALIVDVPKGVGVASLGNNVLGGLALSAVAGDLDIGSTDYLFQKNRGTVAYLTNSSIRSFYLPANPHDGQVVIVIQGSTGKITFHHPGKRLVIQNTVKDSGVFYSGSQGQFNIFIYIGSMWYGTYCNG